MMIARPPYMAVFGQIPRIAAGLLQDDKALVCHPEQHGAVRPDILRAEAMKALADINTSQALRRAVLRKTAPGPQRDLQPGHCNLAHTGAGKSPKDEAPKRKGHGSWHDSCPTTHADNKSAWLHSGTATVHVALEQLRGAVGFEHWQPTREDRQTLKDAAANIRQDLWQERSTTAPPADEDSYEYPLERLAEPQASAEQHDTAAAPEAEAEQLQPLALPLAPPPQKRKAQQEQTRQQQTTDAQTTPRVSARPEAVQQLAEQYIQQIRTTTMNVEGDIHIHSYPTSPTGQAVTPLDYHPGRYGLTRAARSRTPTNRRIRKSAEQQALAHAWPTPVPETPQRRHLHLLQAHLLQRVQQFHNNRHLPGMSNPGQQNTQAQRRAPAPNSSQALHRAMQSNLRQQWHQTHSHRQRKTL